MAILPSAPPVVPDAPAAPWRRILQTAVRDFNELCRLLRLDPRELGPPAQAARGFPLLVPRPYLARIRPGDPQDPLLRQVLPLAAEDSQPAEYSTDPVGDAAAQLAPGVLQKYASRVLVVTTGACAVHCRYCFRRAYPYSDLPAAEPLWDQAVSQIAADRSLREVILSGGDPLTLSDERLAPLVQRLANIAHLRRLRVHTRLPIVIPQRVDDALLGWLTGGRLTPWVVVHVNHPRELDAEVAAALGRLVDAGVPVLNQAVLLRGVNDDLDVLTELCERLVELRVLPYYLHQLDRVSGAAHFAVPPRAGRRLVAQLRRRVSGYAVPRYVRELAGRPHKLVIA